jgi:transketolase
MGLKLRKSKARVYCLLGDGEIQEGQVWEAVLSAPKFHLENLVAIVDNNNGQIDGTVDEVMDLKPLAEKWRAFRWNTLEIDGHDIGEIISALKSARAETSKPTVIIARTVKGKGVSFMENDMGWHGVTPNPEETARALSELNRGVR